MCHPGPKVNILTGMSIDDDLVMLQAEAIIIFSLSLARRAKQFRFLAFHNVIKSLHVTKSRPVTGAACRAYDLILGKD